MLLFAALLLLVSQTVFSAHDPAAPVRYNATFEEHSLAVQIDWPEIAEDSVIFEMGEWAGVNDFYRDIEGVSAHNSSGEPLAISHPDSARWVVHCGHQRFRLEYQVVCRKESFSGSGREDHFRPTILPGLGYVWGVSALLMPADSTLEQSLAQLIIDRGEYRMAAASLDSSTVTTVGKLRDCLMIGGDYREISRRAGELTISFYLHGAFAFEDSQFTDAVEQVLSAHISYFGDYPLSRQTVVLVEGTPNSSGGTVTDGIIAVYPDPTDSLRGGNSGTLRLISHEHFHVWAEKLKVAEDHAEGYYKWFTEGFADYYADLTLYRTALADEEDFVQAMNRQILTYYGNPLAFTATADSFALRYWSGADYNKLPYAKGALIGLLLDVSIAHQTEGRKSLDQYIRGLLSKSSEVKDGFTDSILVNQLNQLTNSEWKPFYDRYMLGAEELPFEELLHTAGITVLDSQINLYSLGFVTESGAMRKGERIKSVINASGAETQGLLPGDTLAGYSYYSDDMSREVEIKVVREGKTITFKYYPTVARAVPQIVGDAPTISAIRRHLKNK